MFNTVPYVKSRSADESDEPARTSILYGLSFCDHCAQGSAFLEESVSISRTPTSTGSSRR